MSIGGGDRVDDLALHPNFNPQVWNFGHVV